MGALKHDRHAALLAVSCTCMCAPPCRMFRNVCRTRVCKVAKYTAAEVQQYPRNELRGSNTAEAKTFGTD